MSKIAEDLYDHKLRNETIVRIADAAERIATALEAIESAPQRKAEQALQAQKYWWKEYAICDHAGQPANQQCAYCFAPPRKEIPWRD